MKRPPVTLENYQEVYDFYDTYRPNKLGTWLLYAALGTAFAPHVVYADGTKEQIAETLDSNKSLVIVANHTRDVDPCVMASTLFRQPALRPMIGNTFIPAKSPIFYDLIRSPAFLNPVLRRAVDSLYSVPVFRDKEYGKDNPLLRPAARRLLANSVANLNIGDHMAILGEGERNTTDPTKIQKIQSGVGVMVCRATEVEQPALVTMGMYYGQDKKLARNPTVYVGEASQQPFEKPRQVIDWLQAHLQASVDAAVKYSEASR